jgi:hypothetical protein
VGEVGGRAVFQLQEEQRRGYYHGQVVSPSA